MAKPRILIVDDEAPARSRLRTVLSDIEAECPHEVAGEASDGLSALEEINRLGPDVVLMDVQMPVMTGLEAAAHLASRTEGTPAVIFVTAYDEFALKAFEVHAIDYLLKPVRAERLAQAITRAADTVEATRRRAITTATDAMQVRRRHFSVQERDRVVLVPIEQVLYLKAEQKYVTIRTSAREHLIEESLASIEQELSEVFIRVHRNALVARAAIVGVERGAVGGDADAETDKGQEAWHVILTGIDERLPISRRQWTAVKALVK